MPSMDDVRELIQIADEFVRENQLDKAISFLLQAIELDPNYALVRYKLACIYGVIGNYDAAIEEITLALKMRQEDDQYPEELYKIVLSGSFFKKKDYKMVIKTLNQMIKKNPTFNEAPFIVAGEAYYELKDFQKMSAIAKKGLKYFPDSVIIKSVLGVAYHNLGDLINTANILNDARNNCPNDTDNLIFVGLAHCRVGKSDIGLDLMNKAIQLSPENPICYHYLAKAYLSLGNISNALSAIDKAIEFNPQEVSLREFKNELESLK